MSLEVGGDFEAGRGEGEIKYEVRSTKYEVKELGAAGVAQEGRRTQSEKRCVVTEFMHPLG